MGTKGDEATCAACNGVSELKLSQVSKPVFLTNSVCCFPHKGRE